MKYLLFILIFSVFGKQLIAQLRPTPVSAFEASDPASMNSRISTDFESYFFVAAARYYAIRPGYEYGLQNQKHLFGMSLPFVHTIFVANYGGYENTTGVGDLKMRYMLVPWRQSDRAGLQRVSMYVELTAPTGESALGRGTGTWLYKPGMIFTFRPNPYIAFYPEIKYNFSTKVGNNLGGDGAPDQGNPDKDGIIKNLSVSIPAVALVSDWNGWASMNAVYIQSFSEKNYYLFLRLDFGKMVGDNASAAISISKFIAGQPRLDALVQAKVQFFLR